MVWTPAHSTLALRKRKRGRQRDVGPGSAGIGPLRRRLDRRCVAQTRWRGLPRTVIGGRLAPFSSPVSRARTIGRRRRPGGSPRKPRALAARFSPAMRHLDFLRSTQRCIRAPQIPAFRRLELFGFPWILSSEMGLFNGLRATWGQFYFQGGPFPGACVARPAAVDPKAARAEASSPGGKARRAGNHGSGHRRGPIGHWDQTNAVFAFWQEIVDLAPNFA